MGGSKNVDPYLGGPHKKDCSVSGLNWAFPTYGNYHMGFARNEGP